MPQCDKLYTAGYCRWVETPTSNHKYSRLTFYHAADGWDTVLDFAVFMKIRISPVFCSSTRISNVWKPFSVSRVKKIKVKIEIKFKIIQY